MTSRAIRFGGGDAGNIVAGRHDNLIEQTRLWCLRVVGRAHVSVMPEVVTAENAIPVPGTGS